MSLPTVLLKVTARSMTDGKIFLDWGENEHRGFWNQFETPALYCFKTVKQNKMEFAHESFQGSASSFLLSNASGFWRGCLQKAVVIPVFLIIS